MSEPGTEDTQVIPFGTFVEAAFDASPNGVVILRCSGEIVAANQSAERILGLGGGELLGRTSLDPRWRAVHPDGRPFPGETHPAMTALRTTRAVRDVVMGVHTPGGDLRWLRVSAEPIAQGGEVVGVATYFVDITAQRGAEDALLQAQGRLKVASEAGRVGVFEWDPAVETISCDEPAARIVGCPTLSKVGPLDTLLGAIHPDDRERASQEIHAALGSPGPTETSFRVVHGDGTVRSIMVRAGVTTAPDGSTRLTGAIVDVSDLRAANQQVVALLESMTEAYFTLDAEFRFSYLNRSAEALLGRRREELVGRVLWDEFPGSVGTAFEANYRQVLSTGESVAFEAFFPPHDRFYDVRAHAVDGGLAVYFLDVSAGYAAEAERERLLEAERTAQAMAERARAELATAATHDVLTGLPNRASLGGWLAERLDALAPDRLLAVGYVDLDRFQRVNDSWGHSEGDRLLVHAARRLRAELRSADFIARLGGDEFVIVLEGASRSEVLSAADRVTAALRDPFELGGRKIVVTASLGLVFATSETGPEGLVRDADAALRRAKESGRDRIAVFDDTIRAAALARVEVEADLRAALDNGDVVAHYQPAFSLATGVPVGVEALARWTHRARGPVAPSEFIPVAEDTGLIGTLGAHILRTAVGDADVAAIEAGNPELMVWVNASPRELTQPDFADGILQMVEEQGLAQGRLGLEVVESALVDDSSDVLTTLLRLAAGGVRIAIDDFGTGYSSLSRLHSYPVDVLKIDRSFVSRLEDPGARPIVAAIVKLGHALGATVSGEGVETAAQLDVLRDLGVDSACGFYLARPDALQNLAASARAGSTRVCGRGATLTDAVCVC